jgi:transposase
LPLADPGFHYSALCEHRKRIVENEAQSLLLEELLKRFQEKGLIKKRGKQRTDSTHVLAAIREVNRLECVGETLRHALNSLALVVPDWVRRHVPVEWYDRYGRRFEQWRLPQKDNEWEALFDTVGQDGYGLLQAIYDPASPSWLREVPAVQILRQVWLQRFYVQENQLRRRQAEDMPSAERRIISPYDTEARMSIRRSTEWTGYRVHLSETCEADKPLLITNVETTPSTTPDSELTEPIHRHLEEKGLAPGEHLADAGYVDAQALADSEDEYHIDLIGPAPKDTSWQARAGEGFDLTSFHIEWERREAICPQQQHSACWFEREDSYGTSVIYVKFPKKVCLSCSERARCTHSAQEPRVLKLRPKAHYLALQRARERQSTSEFKEQYAVRSGIEGTISQGTRAFGLRRSRYVGLAKTHLQHILTAIAMNLMRLADWYERTKRASTRCSAFAALAPA